MDAEESRSRTSNPEQADTEPADEKFLSGQIRSMSVTNIVPEGEPTLHPALLSEDIVASIMAPILLVVDEPEDLFENGHNSKRILKSSNVIRRPVKGDLVIISLTGQLEDGTVVEAAEKLEVHVGDFEVVEGVDRTMPLMNVGEVFEVMLNSSVAYGALGLENVSNPEKSIPPNATLLYELHLLDSKHEDAADLQTFELRRKYGQRKKERANFWYSRNEYQKAIHLYKRSLEYFELCACDPGLEANDDAQVLLEEGLFIYNNMAMAQILIKDLDSALKSVHTVLRCQPDNSQALYRNGRILDAINDTKGAIGLLQRAATLEPDDKVIQQELAKLIIKDRREEHRAKEIYEKMLGQVKKIDQKNRAQKDRNSENATLKLVGYTVGSLAVIVAAVALYRFKN